MKKYEFIFFDLDGTLTDPYSGISNSIIYALDKFGISLKNENTLKEFIGPPLLDSFMNICNFSFDQAKKAITYYREYFAEKGMLENVVYQGIKELLIALIKSDKKLYVATSKPEKYAKKILEHFNLLQYFEGVFGATFDETRNKKADIIEYALAALKIDKRNKVMMIGDRKYDILGAKACSISSIGVLYGYGSKEELEQAGATYLVEKPADILKILV